MDRIVFRNGQGCGQGQGNNGAQGYLGIEHVGVLLDTGDFDARGEV